MSDHKAVPTPQEIIKSELAKMGARFPNAGAKIILRELARAGVAVTALPERVDGRWPVDREDDDFSVWRITMRRERDGRHVNGARISWGAMELNLGGDHTRALAAALLAVVSEGETHPEAAK